MTNRRSPLAAGLSAALGYRRLAGVLWLGLVLSALPAWVAFGPLFAPIDQSPFRERLLAGWDSWAFLSFVGVFPTEISIAFASLAACLALSVLLDLLLTTGAVRVLLSGLPRPALRRVVAEGAALFRPVAWAFARYLLSLAFWVGLVVVAPALLLGKVAGENAPPNGALANLRLGWIVLGSLLVVANVHLRFSLARVAIARGEASNARGAYREAKKVLHGSRPAAVGVWLFWAAVGLAVQAAFTALGLRMNPGSGAALLALVLVRQAGFWLLAATRVGFQASLLAFSDGRRPEPALPLAHPVAPTPATVPESPAAA